MSNATVETPIIEVASTLREVEEIQRFRYQVYASEMKLDLPGVDHVRRILADPLDLGAIHVIARVDSQLAGAVRLNLNEVPEGLEFHLESESLPRPYVYCSRMYVLKQFRGSGVMEELVKASFTNFYEQNAAAAICHCYEHLLNLYERLGFRAYGTCFITARLEHLGEQTPLRRLFNRQRARRAA